jgi:DNA-binding GntR family transcriptional regulator
VLSETDLARRLGVSRTPLREAMSRLVEHGLVQVTPQVGTTVSLIDLGEVQEATFVRTALETAAFRLAVQNKAPVDRLRDVLQQHEQAQHDGDAEAFHNSDDALHQVIFDLAGFPSAWSVVRASRLQLDRVRRMVLPESIKSRDVVDEHIRIVDLLESRDTARGVRLVTAHAHRGIRLLPRLSRTNPTFFTWPRHS